MPSALPPSTDIEQSGIVVAQGPFDEADALTALAAYPTGSVLYETDGTGAVIAGWVKTSD